MFTNDFWPRAVDEEGQIIDADWTLSPTLVKRRAVIGSGVTVLPVTIGEACFVGAGSVVTRDVPDYALVYGNPARVHGWVDEQGKKLKEIGKKIWENEEGVKYQETNTGLQKL